MTSVCGRSSSKARSSPGKVCARAHQSVDVDVLVHPADRTRLLAGLDRHGWAVAVQSTSARGFTQHSVTVQHPSWICEIDVHDRFPGFLADPAVVFEALWERRETSTLAGRGVSCPDMLGHAQIAALHWLRDGRLHEPRLDFLCRTLDARLDATGRRDLVELAARTGSVGTLRPMFDSLGITDLPSSGFDETEWRIRTASTALKSVGWVLELSQAPWRRLPARLLHALVLTEDEIRLAQPDAAPGAWGLFRARLRRLRRGLRDMPRAFALVRRERRT